LSGFYFPIRQIYRKQEKEELNDEPSNYGSTYEKPRDGRS
jgi:hypothetical protein